MSRKKRKKGSSLLVVIIVMGILFTTGTTILTVTASDYKMRVNESKKIKNLYEADSGLDVIENIIIKTSEDAINYSDNKIKEALPTLTADQKKNENLNVMFKGLYYEFLNKEIQDGTEKIGLLKYLIKNKKIINGTTPSGEFTYEERLTDAIIDLVDYSKNNDNIIVTVQSTFETMEGDFKNKKTVQTKYIVKAPEYKTLVNSQEINTNIDIYPVFDDKIITTDGNLDITGKLDVTGNIWVKGNPDNILNPIYTFDKYRGGVKITEGELTLIGNLYTANSLNLKNNTKVSVDQKVYALNAYVGKEKSDVSSQNNILTINDDLIVNNDLALNSRNSNILIKKNFYGISDKNTENITTADKALKSSSIIINETSDSNCNSLTVNGDSYIMGVAYIDAKNENGADYQTGESVAIKGNYKAYSDILPGYEGKVNLKYYNPLQLIDSIDGNYSIAKKAEYFKEYYKYNSASLKVGGINLKGTVNSVGAIIKNNVAEYRGLTSEAIETVEAVKDEYVRNVFAMGDMTGIASNIESVAKTVANQIKFDEIKSTSLTDEFNVSFGQVVLNNKESNVVELENNKITVKDSSGNLVAVKEGKIGLIITNGNVIIKKGTDFTGNIIALGNITITGDSNSTKLTYDVKVTRSIIAANNSVLSKIFTGTKKSSEVINIGEETKITGSKEYPKESYLESGNWKIIK